jgi:hypothetical protein
MVFLTSHPIHFCYLTNICLQIGSTLIITRGPAKLTNQHLLHVITIQQRMLFKSFFSAKILAIRTIVVNNKKKK